MLIQSNSDVLSLTDILLETYKLEQTSLVLNKSETNINHLIKDVCDEMMGVLISNSMNIEFDENGTVINAQKNTVLEAPKLSEIEFDENGELVSRYGLFKDVSTDSTRKMTRPVDFLLKGFKNSKWYYQKQFHINK